MLLLLQIGEVGQCSDDSMVTDSVALRHACQRPVASLSVLRIPASDVFLGYSIESE